MNTTAWPADRVERRDVASLIPYARNARTHSDAQVAQIAASIAEWGWTTPVLVDDAGVLIAGHGRVLAAQKLGIAEVPVMVATGWTKAQIAAYRLADNKLALNAGWDSDLLKIELGELSLDGCDLPLIGFGPDELAGLLDEPGELNGMPTLPDGDKPPFQQITFTLHDMQAEQVKSAIEVAKGLGPFTDSQNENSNGNALARVCETYLTAHAER